MANIALPGMNLIHGYSSGGEGSPGAAAAPWAATAQVGQQLQDMGDRVVDFQVKAQRANNIKMANDLEIKANDLFEKFQNDSLTDGDPAGRPERWQKMLGEFKSQNLPDGLAPEQQVLMGERLARFQSSTSNHVVKGAVLEGIQQSRMSAETLMDQKINAGDRAGAEQSVNDNVAHHVYSPAEGEKIKAGLGQRFEMSDAQQHAQQAPLATRDALVEKNADGTWKNYRNLDPAQRERLSEYAKGKYHESVGEAIEDSKVGMSDGSIKTPEDIDKKYSATQSAQVLYEMKGELARRTAGEYKAQIESPEYQAQATAQASGLLDGLTYNAPDFDKRLAQADYAVDSLKDSPHKRYLQGRLAAAKQGAEFVVKTHADAAQKALREYNKRDIDKYDVTGSKPGDAVQSEQIATQQAINDGFITDKTKLLALGFDEAQAKSIIEGIGFDKQKPKSVNATQQLDAFKTLWVHRANPQADAGGLVQQTALAIVGGKHQAQYLSPAEASKANEGRRKAEIRAGQREIKLAEWLAIHPDAKPEQIDAQVLDIGGADTRDALKSGRFDPRPVAPGAAVDIPGATSMRLPPALDPLKDTFIAAGARYGVDPRALAAISMHETGNGTSSAFRHKNNAMGVSNSSGPISFDHADDSIYRMARHLASSNGPYRNARTLGEIASIYAPVGAENDPGALNGGWLAGVSHNVKRLGGNPSLPIR